MAEVNKEVFANAKPPEQAQSNVPATTDQTKNEVGQVDISFGQKVKDLSGGVWTDVIRPALIDIGYNAVCDAAARVAKGFSDGWSPNYRSNDYNAQYRGERPVSDFRNQNTQTNNSGRYVKVTTYRDIVISSRMDAQRILDELKDYIYRYQKVPVKNFYENDMVYNILVNSGYKIDDWTLQGYGWTNLDGATIRNVPNGYKLILPDPVRIN